MQITSGRGPTECCWVVAQVAEKMLEDAGKLGIQADILEAIPGEEAQTYKSILLSMEGQSKDQSEQFIGQWMGTVQWIGKSQFRPHHKRKNWYVGVEAFLPPEQTKWSPQELNIETMRASGPGAQHVNKVETAVRITHLPTGISVTAQEERSQMLNRKLALARIAKAFEQIDGQQAENIQQDRWRQHNELERGNPVQVFQGKKFKRK